MDESVMLLLTDGPRSSTPLLEMPLAARGRGSGRVGRGPARLEPKRLHAWLHWAALPKVASLDEDSPVAADVRVAEEAPEVAPEVAPASDGGSSVGGIGRGSGTDGDGATSSFVDAPAVRPAARFLREGDVGILIGGTASSVHEPSSAHDGALLRALSRRLASDSLHGLTLLHVARGGAAYRELMPKMRAASASVADAVEEAVATGETARGGAGGLGGALVFVIVRLAGSRVAEVSLLPLQQPEADHPASTTSEALYGFCATFLRARHGYHRGGDEEAPTSSMQAIMVAVGVGLLSVVLAGRRSSR
jgi:hypothetical protein